MFGDAHFAATLAVSNAKFFAIQKPYPGDFLTAAPGVSKLNFRYPYLDNAFQLTLARATMPCGFFSHSSRVFKSAWS